MTFLCIKRSVCLALASSGLLGITVSMVACEPRMHCASAHGDYAMAYTLTSGDPASPCGSIAGEVVGFQSYVEERGSKPALDEPSVGIQASRLGELMFHANSQGVFDPSPDNVPYSLGEFRAGHPDSEGFCQVEETSTARQNLPTVPAVPDDPETEEDESIPAVPATDITYTWSDIEIYVTPNAQGTQLTAEVQITERVTDAMGVQTECTASYDVLGLYPATLCMVDEDCTDPESGINPDFPVECNAAIGLCMLTEEPPALE
jgi:hypothetical protein